MMSINGEYLAKTMIERHGHSHAYRLAVDRLCNAALTDNEPLRQKWDKICQVIEDETYKFLNNIDPLCATPRK